LYTQGNARGKRHSVFVIIFLKLTFPKHTAIIEALEGVVRSDWGDEATTAKMRSRARGLILKWT